MELLEFRSIPLNVTELTITDWIFQIPLSLIALTLFFFLKKHICAKQVFSIEIYISIQSVSESFTLACWDKSLSHSLKPENVTCIFFNLILNISSLRSLFIYIFCRIWSRPALAALCWPSCSAGRERWPWAAKQKSVRLPGRWNKIQPTIIFRNLKGQYNAMMLEDQLA